MKKKRITCILASSLASGMLFSGCGSAAVTEKPEEVKQDTTPEPSSAANEEKERPGAADFRDGLRRGGC